jgi:hypothetical protein
VYNNPIASFVLGLVGCLLFVTIITCLVYIGIRTRCGTRRSSYDNIRTEIYQNQAIIV